MEADLTTPTGVAPDNERNAMPQSLSVVYLHLVFSTKDRCPFLRDQKLRLTLHAYLGEVSKRLDCHPILVGGIEDHVHVLARFGRTITLDMFGIETQPPLGL
jgi:putative transposase